MGPFYAPVEILAATAITIEHGQRVLAAQHADIEHLPIIFLEVEGPSVQEEIRMRAAGELDRLEGPGGTSFNASPYIETCQVARDGDKVNHVQGLNGWGLG